MSHRHLVALAAATVLCAAAPAAHASYPGANGKIVYAGSGGDLVVMNPDGSGKHRLTATAAQEFDPVFSPDGARVAFARSAALAGGGFTPPDVYVMNVGGGGLFRLTADPGSDRDPTWSPDGAQIAFTSDRSGHADIYRVRATPVHPAPVRLTTTTARFAGSDQPAWSPLGDRIAYLGPNNSVMTMDAGTGLNKRDLQTLQCSTNGPSWSPDGAWIAYSAGNGCGSNDFDEVIVVRPDGSGTRYVTPATDFVDSDAPAWSPDGTRIAFVANGIETIRVDGKGLARLSNVYGDWSPDWQPLPG